MQGFDVEKEKDVLVKRWGTATIALTLCLAIMCGLAPAVFSLMGIEEGVETMNGISLLILCCTAIPSLMALYLMHQRGLFRD